MRLFFSLLLFVSNAQASEFFHQAPAGVFESTVTASWDYAITRYANGGKIESNDAILSYQAEMGLGDWAVGAILGFGYGKQKRFGLDEDSDGLEDLYLYGKSFRTMWDGSLRYGGHLRASFENKIIDNDNYSNRQSGGYWANLYIGYEHIHKPHVLGVKISRDVSLGERIEENEVGGEVDVKGAEDLEVSFYMEKPKEGEAYWGGIFSYTLTTDRNANGNESELLSPVIRFQIYRPTPLGGSLLIPLLSLGTSLTEKVSGAELDEYTEISGSVAYRF